MTQKTKIHKDRKIILWFLRLFSEYREIEARCKAWEESLELSEKQYKQLEKKSESDAALIESLNRYINALEGRAQMHEEMMRELKQKLKELLPRKQNARRKKT